MKLDHNHNIKWPDIKAAYTSGNASTRAIAKVYGVAESVIRYRARAQSWERAKKPTSDNRVAVACGTTLAAFNSACGRLTEAGASAQTLAVAFAPMAIQVLAEIALSGDKDSARVAAANALLAAARPRAVVAATSDGVDPAAVDSWDKLLAN